MYCNIGQLYCNILQSAFYRIVSPLIAVTDIFNKIRKCCNYRCPDSVYFDTLLLIMYLTATETLICHREMSLIGSTSFGLAKNTIHDFQNMVLNS